MILILESVFTMFPAIYNTDTNIVIFADQEYTYSEFNAEYLVLRKHTVDAFAFKQEFEEALFLSFLYEELYIQYYSPPSECYF